MTDENEDILSSDENNLISIRRKKLSEIRTKRQAFPNDFKKSVSSSWVVSEFNESEKSHLEEISHQVSVAGRIIRMRGPFVVILDEGVKLQLYLNSKTLSGQLLEEYKLLDFGDIIGVDGEIFKTNKGELTVRVSTFRILTKALRPLPDKHKGLNDTELRYRKRYVDLIVNEESRHVFEVRSKIIRSIRNYFESADFMEVETPMMQVIPGGATARPFTTHHNALNQDMYLRIAPELYLKRLVVGGFERVFELNRNFRNEGLSTRHNPEFTMIEFYQAYATYSDLMNLTEDLFKTIAREVLGSEKISYQGSIYDFSEPFRRLTVLEAIEDFCGVQKEQLSRKETASDIAESLDVTIDENWGLGKIIMEIFEQQVEDKLDQPTFITEYPTEVSPLARRNELTPDVTDRFELIIGGRELANGFSELNDPEDQAERFAIQVADKESGDKEAMHFDEDYITALEYGLPPTAGEGIGIDRLVMLFTDSPSIKDVLLFPHMRPEKESD